MSKSTPFHKQTNPNRQAGQHVYGFDREPYLKHSNVAPDVTLSDYIARKTDSKETIAFQEWYLKEEEFLKRMGCSRVAAKVAFYNGVECCRNRGWGKQEDPSRITFEEWASEHVFTGRTRHDEWRMSGIQVDFLRGIWEYALKNGKIS